MFTAAGTENPFLNLEKTININNVPYKYYDIPSMGGGYGKWIIMKKADNLKRHNILLYVF